MSKKFLSGIDLTRTEIQNAVIQNLASAPSSPVEGLVYYSTTSHVSYEWNDTAWVARDAAKVADGTIPLSKLATDPLDRANHTGTQLASTISDFNTAVRTNRLDQMAAPTASVSFNNQLITNLADAVSAQDAVNLRTLQAAVASAAAGIDSKPSVRVLANTNQTLSGLPTVDGITLTAGQRILLVNQTDPTQNGPYVVASGSWVRASDELTPGAFWYVEEGTSFGKTQWRIENTGTITPGTTSITINQFGAVTTYTNGNGLNLTGTTFSVKPASGGGIVVDASGVAIDNSIVVRKYAANIGDGSATTISISHNLGTRDVNVQIYRNSTPWDTVECDVTRPDTNTVTIAFAVAPSSAAYRVVVQA